MIFNLLTLILSLIYSCFIFWCLYHWVKIPVKVLKEKNNNSIKVAVIIPARNEEKNIPGILKLLKMQDYPVENFQIVICDDHSTDNTYETTKKIFYDEKILNGICLTSNGESKKNAIAFAVENTEAELIITTDADTRVNHKWISAMVEEYVSSGSFLICGPVKLTGTNNYFEKLQQIEFTGLSGISAAGISSNKPMMCNGANLAFSKNIFKEVNGYDDSKSSSGDDTQLMIKIHQRFPGKISFLKNSDAIVETSVLNNKSDLWQQRRRWASKIPYTLTPFTIGIAAIAWFVHAFLLIQLFLFFIHGQILFLFLPWTMKIVSEIIFLKKTGKFFSMNIPMWIIISSQPLYSIYIVGTGLIAPLGKYRWKGRVIK